jgi:pimeloyl-ACP methyl ester carboxylesterase
LGSWSYNWRHIIEPLSQYFRVVGFDAKGYGFSEKPLSRREENSHQVIELERIIQALCHEPPVILPVILAEYLGALVSLALAGQSPHLIDRLVVMNAPIFTDKLPHWLMALLAQTPLKIIQTIDFLPLADVFAPILREVMAIERRRVLFEPSILSEEDVYWKHYPFIEIPGTLLKVAEELQIAVREIENSQAKKPNMLIKIQNNLCTMECPTLILWGDQDSFFPASHGEKLHQNIRNSRFQLLHNCYHDASTGASEVVKAEIIKFLQDTNFC